MRHNIPIHEIGSFAEPMAEAVQACVHCGFCLPTCPTYQLLGQEMDSPRGRIFLMKEVLEGNVDLDEAAPYIDRCLGCVGCVTACPSGVQYGELLTPFRARAETRRRRSLLDHWMRRFVLETLPYPHRFRWGVWFGRFAKPLRRFLPGRLGDMLDLLPNHVERSQPLPAIYAAEGKRRAKVALVAGCAQQVLAPDINWATLRVLSRHGVEVLIPPSQVCCGALAAHTGALWQAKRFARQNLQAFPQDVDAILTNAAGCGSGLQEYGLWLRGEPEQEAAEQFASRVQDVSVFLAELGVTPPPALGQPLRVAFHDACHLAHAQKVKMPPRRLLSSVENLDLVEIPAGDICCGSAGTYNIEQPELAAELGRRKIEAILSTDADVVASGNIGCLTQIETHLRQQRRSIPVLHTIQILDRCYRRQAIQ